MFAILSLNVNKDRAKNNEKKKIFLLGLRIFRSFLKHPLWVTLYFNNFFLFPCKLYLFEISIINFNFLQFSPILFS